MPPPQTPSNDDKFSRPGMNFSFSLKLPPGPLPNLRRQQRTEQIQREGVVPPYFQDSGYYSYEARLPGLPYPALHLILNNKLG